MTEILTESFCERCGTRYTFESARPRARLKGVRVLSRGLKNFVLSDDTSMDEAMAAARSDTDRESTSHQLDAFHKTFNFCMTCRQYTCPNCWNEVEARCLTCAPHLGHEIMPAPFPDLATTELVGAEARFDGANGSNGANDLGYGDVAAVTDAAPSDGEGDFDLAARLDSLTAAAPVTDPNATRRSVREKTTGQTGGLLGRFRPGESLDAELDAFEQDRHAEPPAEPEMVAEAAAEVAAKAQAVAQAEVVVAASEAFNETEIVAPPEVAAEAEPEPVAVTEPQPAIAAEALAGPEPMAQPDAAAELEPEAVADAQAVAEPEIVAGPEPEWVAEAEAVGAPEPVEEVAAEPELIAEPEAVGEPEPVAEVAADPEWVAEPDPISAEPEPEPDSPVVDVVPQPTWRMVAPDPAPEVPHTPPPEPGATIPAPTVEPQWPTRPEWLGDTPAAGLPFLGRAAAPQGGLEALWAESTREVVAPTSGRAAGGVQPCVSCGLSLSANARFCRRCGTSQPT
ncbi:MAG: hypothetical protein QOC97_1148 [Chloroflexota bacterium]|nr:hypothetical protein [Chloroflexota bacterium]